MPRRQWSDLSERTRRLLISAAVADSALRVAALVDIRSPADLVLRLRAASAAVIGLPALKAEGQVVGPTSRHKQPDEG